MEGQKISLGGGGVICASVSPRRSGAGDERGGIGNERWRIRLGRDRDGDGDDDERLASRDNLGGCAQDLRVTGTTEMAGRSGSVRRDAKRLEGL